MAKPVIVLEEGGTPCVLVTGGTPMTEVLHDAPAITLVEANGIPITLIDEYGVPQRVNADPVIESVSISGVAQVGSPLTASYSGHPGVPEETPAWQWLDDSDAAIPDATDDIFVPQQAYAALKVRLFLGDEEADSDPIAVTEAPPDAPVVTDPGAISSATGLGKIGHPHTVTGFTFTGDGVTLTRAWERGGTPISGATGFSYTPVAADDLTSLTAVTTATNITDSDSGETEGRQITYVAPTATDTGVWGEEEDTGSQTYDASPLFFVFADAALDSVTWSITGAAAGSTIDSSGIVTITTANALTGTITVRATNSGGFAETTIALTISAPPIVAPTITAIADQNLAIHASAVTTITATASAGTAPIIWSLTPAVFKPTIEETSTDVYGFNRLYAADSNASVTLEHQWVVDGVDATGETGQTFDNTVPQYGAFATADLSVKFRINGGAWAESDAVEITGANLTNPPDVTTPVLLSARGAAGNGTNTASAEYNTTHGDYSVGDLVIVAQGNDRQASQVSPISITQTDGDPGGPNGETIVTDQALFDNGGALGASGTCMALFHYIATSAVASGANIQGNVTTNNEQFAMPVLVFDAGTFDPDNPIDDVTTASSGTVVANAASASFTASMGGGKVVCIVITDDNGVNNATPPSGWTYATTTHDFGAIGIAIAVRTALTVGGEVVAAANFPLTADGRWVSTTFVVNPGPPAAADYSVYYGPSGEVPVLIMDFDNEVYARITNGGTDLEEIADIETFITNFTAIETIGSTTGLRIGAGRTPRFLTSQFDFSLTEGTMVITYECNDVTTADKLIDINDGTTANSIRIYASGGTTWRSFVRVNSGSASCDINTVAVNEAAPQTIAFAWKANDFAAVADGGTVTADATGTLPAALSTVCLGSNNGSGDQPEGVIKMLRLFDARMINANLDTISGA